MRARSASALAMAVTRRSSPPSTRRTKATGSRSLPGTYDGGVVIGKSIELRGAGATATVISGGGPGPHHRQCRRRWRADGFDRRGHDQGRSQHRRLDGRVRRGVLIAAAPGGGRGATVTIVDSVITGNRATPTVAAPIGPPCPSGPCGFALRRWRRDLERRRSDPGQDGLERQRGRRAYRERLARRRDLECRSRNAHPAELHGVREPLGGFPAQRPLCDRWWRPHPGRRRTRDHQQRCGRQHRQPPKSPSRRARDDRQRWRHPRGRRQRRDDRQHPHRRQQRRRRRSHRSAGRLRRRDDRRREHAVAPQQHRERQPRDRKRRGNRRQRGERQRARVRRRGQDREHGSTATAPW